MALSPNFLVDVPSHFNWSIDIGTVKEFNSLKLQLDEHLAHNPGVMTIQALLLQSFIHVSKYKDPKPDYGKGRRYLYKAYDEIERISNEEEKRGYLIVAKCNEAFMAHILEEQTTSLEAEIQGLLSEKTDISQACIDSVRAFALTRVGMNKYAEAKIYFKKALAVQPNNTQWLFGLALVTGRLSRIKDGLNYTSDKEEERQLYEKILTIDKNHALAYVFLAFNYSFKGEHAVAMRHASKARELAPHQPHLLVKASKVFRRADCYDTALEVLQDACKIGKNSALFHEIGLVYRDMYDEQIRKKEAAVQKKETFDQPDKSLLYKVIEYTSKALEANPTNNEAIRDRALTFERLEMTEEAEDDFISVLAVKNTDFIDKVRFKISYALFLQHTCNMEEKACERYQKAIACAVKNCVTHPVTQKSPKPIFDGAVKTDLDTAKESYKNVLEKKVHSADPKTHSQGLKGLAWLDQVYGEHDSARAMYEEYLKCHENRKDSDAIHALVKTLIQLGDFEEARQRIQELKELQKLDLAQQLTVECALVQGEELQAQDDELAKKLFQEAIECGSMEACQKLKDILIKNPDISRREFRIDCAKILHCCEKNEQEDTPLNQEIKKLMELDDVTYGKLRNYHLNLELSILATSGAGVTRAILDKVSQTIYEARAMLDRVMISFREQHYPDITGSCLFFNIQQDYDNQPKTEQRIKEDILKKLNKYQWVQFDTRFPDLLDFLIKLQSGYPGNTETWYLSLSQLANRDKHSDVIRYSQYNIPIILNGKRGVTPVIPRGTPVYGDVTVHLGQDGRVRYELVTVVDVARKAAVEVECIVAEFYKHM